MNLIASHFSPPSSPRSRHGWPSEPGWAPVLERPLPPPSDDPPPRGSPPPLSRSQRSSASKSRPSRGSYRDPAKATTRLQGSGRGKPYNNPSPPTSAPTTRVGPLGARLAEGSWTTHLPPITQARRFFFYPVPDDISVADLREELRWRFGAVVSLRVNEGLADVEFKTSQGARGLNFRKLSGGC